MTASHAPRTGSPWHKRRAWRSLRPAVMVLAVLAAMASLTGCQYFMIASVLMQGPEKTPRTFQLPNKRTLVMIDDPDNVLNNPALEGVIEANVEFNINQNIGPDSDAKQEDQFTGSFVPLRDLATVQGRLGAHYPTTPIDEIGRQVGAATVVYVRIVSFSIPMSLGLNHPRAITRVKIIDATTGQRLFPAPDPVGNTVTHMGHEVDTELTEQTYDMSQPGIRRTILRDVAQQTGRDVARLFYQWTAPEIGNRLPG